MKTSILKSKPIYSNHPEFSSRFLLLIIAIIFFALFAILFFASNLTSINVNVVFLGMLSLVVAFIIGIFIFIIIVFKQSLNINKRIKAQLSQRRYLSSDSKDFSSHLLKTVVSSEFGGGKEVVKDKDTFKAYFNRIDDSALINQSNSQDAALRENQASYRFYDITYRSTSQHPRKNSQYYYTVLELKLRKMVPHLVFDSKFANMSQFKSIYAGGQELQAGAGFDQYFTIYAPQYHSVEALSFITPEVMEAMLDLRECDFEFIEDSLFCYAPLLNEAELMNLRHYGLQLHSEVNNNLPQYTTKVNQVDTFGRLLLKNPWRNLGAIIFTSLIFLVHSSFQIFFNNNWSIFQIAMALAFIAGIAGGIAQIIKTKRNNKRLKENFMQSRLNQ